MMLKWILPAALLAATPAAQAGMWDKMTNFFGQEESKEQTIKVLLAEEKEGVMLQLTGGHNIYDPNTGERIATRFSGKTSFIQPISAGIKWGELFPKTFQLHFVPDHNKSTILVDGRQYEGSLYVYAVEGRLTLINEVPVENYVLSRLTNQFPEPLPEEAMNAVTIAARTDAYFHAQNGKNKYWDVKAEEIEFTGYAHTQNAPHIAKAILATRGMMMSAPGGRTPFAAQWTEHSAGRTVPYHVMYRQDAGAPAVGVESVVAEYDREQVEWSYTISKEDLSQATGLEQVDNLTLHADPTSGKVFAVHLTDGGFSKQVNFLELQRMLGKSRLQSSDFTVEVTDEMVTFYGVGKGHGVGLCLYTAGQMAEKGSNAAEILDSFFPATNITMLPQKQQPVVESQPKRAPKRHRA